MIMCNRPHPDHAQLATHTQLIWSSKNTMSLLHSSGSSSEMKYYLDTNETKALMFLLFTLSCLFHLALVHNSYK